MNNDYQQEVRYRLLKILSQNPHNLTPSGLEAKAGLTISFLRRMMSEYNEIKRQIRELAREANVEEPTGMAKDDVPDEAGRLF